MHSNSFVSYLNRFTTDTAAHEGVFDEHNLDEASPFVGEFHIRTKTEAFLKSRFHQEHPPSIILTGNAGDGKTYMCRHIIETFLGEELHEWKHSDWPIRRGSVLLRVIKDLSDYTEEKGKEILLDLQAVLQDSNSARVFLIAANEGRLRAILSSPELTLLRKTIDLQLSQPSSVDGDRLYVLNLNRVTTSAYVLQALDYFTAPQHWDECQGCPALEQCPAKFNANRLEQSQTSSRLSMLYELLEHLDVHVTIRDMLIHLAYTITGGLSCKTIISQYTKPGNDLFRNVYYENCWGESAAASYRHRLAVIQQIRRLDVGHYSYFEADDFIVNGHSADDSAVRDPYQRLFAADVDLKGSHFAQRRDSYLRGSEAKAAQAGTHEFLEWLPHCRRKLFFEWEDEASANRLIPFLFLDDYLKLVGGNQGALDKTREPLVLGLNRAFTGLFVNHKDALYVTSQYAHSVEQPVPVVKVKISTMTLELSARRLKSEALEMERSVLELVIPHPQMAKDPIKREINLLRFEYLMRLARGGTHNVLAEECMLFVRELKDELLTVFGSASSKQDRIEFFGVVGNQYILKTLYIHEDGSIGS